MNHSIHGLRSWTLPIVASLLLAAGCASMERGAAGHRVVLGGAQEVPPVTTVASGTGVITIAPDRSVSGSVTTSGINATAAHIHQAARGANGPVIVPMVKTGDFTWSIPPGAKLTEAQYAAHRAGDLYVNVHSAAHPGGEIRAQIAAN